MKKIYKKPSLVICAIDDADLICTSYGIEMASEEESADNSALYGRHRSVIWDDEN